MNIRLIPLAASLLVAGSTAFAQQAPAPAETAPATKQGTRGDCPATKPHDHAAERGFPSASKPCKPTAKSLPAAQKPADGHDHGKMHKNQ